MNRFAICLACHLRSLRLLALRLLAFGFVALGLPGAADLAAQTEACPEFVQIPGGSNPEDQTRHRCTFALQPDLSGHAAALPSPRFDRLGRLSVQVVIDPDGQVDPGLTRFRSLSSDRDFADRFLRALHQVRLAESEVSGLSERFAFTLVVETEMRSDTVPERLVWEYRRGALNDTLAGSWVPTEPPPPYTPEEERELLRRVTGRLAEMQVLTANRTWEYCLVLPTPDSVTRREVRAMLPPRLATIPGWATPPDDDCVLDVRRRRLIFSEPIRTGEGRTVVPVSGDHLERWPPGFDGRYFSSWSAYCALLDSGSSHVGCRIQPDYSAFQAPAPAGIQGPVRRRSPEPVHSRPALEGPTQLQLRIHGGGLFLVDTLRAPVHEITSVAALPLFDPGIGLCTRSSSRSALAEWEPDGHRLLRIELDPPSRYRSALAGLVTVIRSNRSSGRLLMACGDEEDQPFAVTSLAGLGPALEGPVELCLEPNCDRSSTIPAHAPLEPVLTASFLDLRPGAIDTDGFLFFRLELDIGVEGLVPVLLLGTGSDLAVGAMVAYDDGSYRYGLNRNPRLPPNSEIRLYLVQR